MKLFLKKLSITAVFLLIVDFVWIGLVALPLYEFANLSLELLFFPAVLAYISILCGIVASQHTTLSKTLVSGGLIGFAMYGVYGFTNAALFSYPLWLAFTDAVWGLVICLIGSYVFYKIS